MDRETNGQWDEWTEGRMEKWTDEEFGDYRGEQMERRTCLSRLNTFPYPGTFIFLRIPPPLMGIKMYVHPFILYYTLGYNS